MDYFSVFKRTTEVATFARFPILILISKSGIQSVLSNHHEIYICQQISQCIYRKSLLRFFFVFFLDEL